MTTIFEESGLHFEFSQEHWWVCKYDDHVAHKNVKIDQHKAVDFVAIYKNSEIFLFEIKSFREHRIENKKRLKNSAEDLTTEIAQKVRDTVAAVIGASRNATQDAEKWDFLAKLLVNPKKMVKIVAWVEEDQNLTEKKQQVELSIRNSKLKQKMKWLSTKTFFCNTNNMLGYEDFMVKRLAI